MCVPALYINTPTYILTLLRHRRTYIMTMPRHFSSEDHTLEHGSEPHGTGEMALTELFCYRHRLAFDDTKNRTGDQKYGSVRVGDPNHSSCSVACSGSATNSCLTVVAGLKDARSAQLQLLRRNEQDARVARNEKRSQEPQEQNEKGSL